MMCICSKDIFIKLIYLYMGPVFSMVLNNCKWCVPSVFFERKIIVILLLIKDLLNFYKYILLGIFSYQIRNTIVNFIFCLACHGKTKFHINRCLMILIWYIFRCYSHMSSYKEMNCRCYQYKLDEGFWR